jgi:uncharacterized membrane protein YkvA (DUF1232 family)
MIVEVPMQNKNPRSLSSSVGFFQKLGLELKLVLRLMKDPRVHPLLKLMPVGGMVYWIVPDILPGPVDDAMVIWFAFYLFMELCPQDVVSEHRQALLKVIPGQWNESNPAPKSDEEPQVVDGKFRD